MKALGQLFIVVGAGLAALGISGFAGSFSPENFLLPGQQGGVSGSFGWSPHNQLEIVAGVVLLTVGLLVRADSTSK